MIVMELCGKDSLTAVLAKALRDPARAADLTWLRRLNMVSVGGLMAAALGKAHRRWRLAGS